MRKREKTERGEIVTAPNQEVGLSHENLLCGGWGTFTLLHVLLRGDSCSPDGQQAVGRVMFPEVTAFSGVFCCIVD